MNPPPHTPLKKSPPLFGQPPSKYEIAQAPPPPPVAPTLLLRKVLVYEDSFFTKSCFMKPIVRYHEIIVFHQDLTTTGSSNKKC